MNFRQKTTLCLLLYIALCSDAFAQVVDIRDPNLRSAIREALELPDEIPLTQPEMQRLTKLDAGGDRGITDLTGLEYATNIQFLGLYHNPIVDISPLSPFYKIRRDLISGGAALLI